MPTNDKTDSHQRV